jgi:hypothetical protein
MGLAWVDVIKKSISAHAKTYQYGSSRSVKIVLSSNEQQQPSCRAHDLANFRALKNEKGSRSTARYP